MRSNAATDAAIHKDVLDGMSAAYLAGGSVGSVKDPLVSPCYADFRGFPPMYLTVGSHETLQDNAEDLAEAARKAKVDMKLEVAEEMQHVHVSGVGRMPEADKTIREVGMWLQKKLAF